MLNYTLDTNCIIEVDCKRPQARAVLALVDAAVAKQVDVALVASSASERQVGDHFLESFQTFRDRVSSLGFGSCPILKPIARWDIAFWDNGVFVDPEGEAREEVIYRTLFPQSPYHWSEYAASKGADLEDRSTPTYFRWRNQILDAQAYWSHEHACRDIFVTLDGRFQALRKSSEFPDAQICEPEEALAMLR